MNDSPNAVSVVRAFHDALATDPDRLAALVSDEVAMAGPRGVAFGRESLRAWAENADVQLTPRRWFHTEQVIVEQTARWRDAATGAWGEPIAVATSFTVRNNQITSIERFDSLEPVLAAAGLTERDQRQSVDASAANANRDDATRTVETD